MLLTHGSLVPSPAWLPSMAALRKRLFHLVAARVGVLMEKVLAGARTSSSSMWVPSWSSSQWLVAGILVAQCSRDQAGVVVLSATGPKQTGR
eukprot:9010332-Prorocentrum_lima.AAC.1